MSSSLPTSKVVGETPSSPQTNGGVNRTVIRRSIVTSPSTPEKPITPIRRGASIKIVSSPVSPVSPSPGEGQNAPPAHGSPGSPEQTDGSPPTPSAQNRGGSIVRGVPKRIVPRVTPDSSPSTPTSTPPTPTQLGSSPASPRVPSVENRINSLRRITKPVLPESPRDGGDLSARRRSNGLETDAPTDGSTPTTPGGTVLPSAITRSMSRRRQQYMNAQANGGSINASPTSPNTPSLETGSRKSLSQEEILGQATPRNSDSPKDDSTDESSFSAVTPQMHKILAENRTVSHRRRSGGLNLVERQKESAPQKRGISVIMQQLCKEDPMRFVNPNLDFANTTTVSGMTDEEVAECYQVKIVRDSESSTEHVAVNVDENEPEESLEEFIQLTKDGPVVVPYRQYFRNPLHNSTIMDIPAEIYMTQEEVSKYNDIVLRLLDTNQDINDFVVFQNEWDNPLHSLLSEQQRIAIKKKNTDRHEKAVIAMLSRSTSIRKGRVLEPPRPHDFSLEHCGKNWKMQLRSLRSESVKETTKDKYSMTNACVYIYDWKYQIERTKSFQRAQAILELKRTNTV